MVLLLVRKTIHLSRVSRSAELVSDDDQNNNGDGVDWVTSHLRMLMAGVAPPGRSAGTQLVTRIIVRKQLTGVVQRRSKGLSSLAHSTPFVPLEPQTFKVSTTVSGTQPSQLQ